MTSPEHGRPTRSRLARTARLAADQPASDDDCSTGPQEVADLIAAEGTA
jgi:hypothetical protein